MKRSLPTEAEAREILARRRTRPAPRPAPRAGKALQGMIKGLDDKFGRGAAALEPRWVEIVGDRLARVTRPQKLTKNRAGGGTLELRVAGPAALLVQHQADDILARVNLFLGEGSVDKLRIAQGPVKPLAEATAKPKSGAAKHRPLSAAQEAELQASLDGLPDGLKSALEKLGRAVLGDDKPPPR